MWGGNRQGSVRAFQAPTLIEGGYDYALFKGRLGNYHAKSIFGVVR
jgi:hypothetical protein